MKKKLIMLLLSCALVLQACSAQNLDIDPKELAVSLRETVAFQDELSLVDEDMAEKLYGIDNFTDMVGDETIATDPETLVGFLTEKGHPALSMEPMM